MMLPLLLLQSDPATASAYAQWGIAGAIVFLVVVFLWTGLKALPTWKGVKDGDKEVRLAEINVREKEAEARAQQAASFAELSGALSSISDVLNNVAIKQKEATDKVLILSRVNAESNERNDEKFDLVIEHIDSLTQRIEAVEKAVKGKENGSQAKNTTPTT
jgi:hypothetical protein